MPAIPNLIFLTQLDANAVIRCSAGSESDAVKASGDVRRSRDQDAGRFRAPAGPCLRFGRLNGQRACTMTMHWVSMVGRDECTAAEGLKGEGDASTMRSLVGELRR